MMRSSLLLALVLACSSCVGIRLVPKEQAARDLDCPVGQVRVESDMRSPGGGKAIGCGRMLGYVQSCRTVGGKEECHFYPTGNVRVGANSMPHR
jgi:hypothetical protein